MSARAHVAAWRFPVGGAVTHVNGWTGVVALAPYTNPATVPAVYVEHARYGCWYAPHVLTPAEGDQPATEPTIARTKGQHGGRKH